MPSQPQTNPIATMKPEPASPWSPLPANEWTREHARHLAARLGYGVHPDFVETIHKLGPARAVERFLAKPEPMPPPEMLATMTPYMKGDGAAARQEMQRLRREAYADYAVAWYRFAREPQLSPQEKLVSFFQNVWVVSFQSVREPQALFAYQALIRRHTASSYPAMCQALATTPAMARYLNLAQNSAKAPNENFARELFELFTLGEGNYSEQDIREAARATTGYSLNREQGLVFNPRRHDDGVKTIFGVKGRFNLEDTIKLVFKQDAAARFLPSQFCSFYLSETPLEPAVLDELATLWRASGYSIPSLCRTVFASRLFYEPRFRAQLVKDPQQFYIGLLQDLELDVPPIPRESFRIVRLMGQPFFNPPNVRGWVGGRAWINSATLSARRQAVESILKGDRRANLNADEERAYEAAAAAGATRFALDIETVRSQLKKDPAKALAQRFLADQDPSFVQAFADAMPSGSSRPGPQQTMALLLATLVSPSYQLC